MLAVAPAAADNTGSSAAFASSQKKSQGCALQSGGSRIKHVLHLTFDNVHLRRDNPNVPSDLEQMPNLLNFLLENGVVSGNHHTPLISHTAHDIVTALTGVYGARSGIPVANSYGFFHEDGTVGFSSSFLYWTAPSGGSLAAGDGLPNMINENGKIAPAPWVPYTRAGCDFGAFSTADIELERVPQDVDTFFGAGSPESVEAHSNFAKASADFLGIAIHCAQGSQLCNNSHARPDPLPDEPGGYDNFSALFGNFHVQPVISPGGPVLDLNGNQITDGMGDIGFPGFSPTATQSLGYVATVLEAGIPVVYFYIADAHDALGGGAFGPGQEGYVQQLRAYDIAWGQFFARLKKDGITPENTLFVITADENDHFVGGPPTPSSCDGVNTPCSYTKLGEAETYIDRLLLSQRGNTTQFTVHSDSAPTFYVVGNPAPTDTVTRTLESDVDALTVTSPITGNNDKLSVFLADQAVMNLLHMVTAAPDRTPTFTMFGNPDYFNQVANKSQGHGMDCSNAPACVFESPAFAWNHGDVQQDITRTWFRMVGPGVHKIGRNDGVFSDHTDSTADHLGAARIDRRLCGRRPGADRIRRSAQLAGAAPQPQPIHQPRAGLQADQRSARHARSRRPQICQQVDHQRRHDLWQLPDEHRRHHLDPQRTGGANDRAAQRCRLPEPADYHRPGQPSHHARKPAHFQRAGAGRTIGWFSQASAHPPRVIAQLDRAISNHRS
jgi:hypothetical protein